MVSLRSRDAVTTKGSVALALAALAAGVVGPAIPAPAADVSTAPPAAAPSHQLTPGEALTQARRTGKAVDVVGSTTETQVVTALPAGRLRVTTSLVPVRKYVAGQWRALDPTLRRTADGSISPTVSTSDLRLSGGGSGPLATMTAQGHTLALSLPMALPAPKLAGDTATYAGVLPGVDLVVRADRQGGFAQVLVVRDAAAAANPALASLTMRTAGDVKVTSHADGSLDAVDHRGRPAFTARVPIMWDSTASDRATAPDLNTGRPLDVATGMVAVSDARGPGVAARQARVGVSVSAAGVRLAPDPAMLSGKDITFPLYIDPTWTPVSPARSAWATVSHSYPGSFYWNNTPDPDGRLQVGNSNEALLPNGIWSRSFLNFAIPVSTLQGATINSAVLNMTQVHAWSCTASTVNIYAPATTLTSGNASWNSWVGVSLGGVVDAKSEAHGRSGCPAAGVSFNVLGPITSAVSAGKTTQTFTLTGVNEASDFNSYKEFDLNTVAMTVEYNHPPNTTGAAQLTTSPPTSCLKSPADVVGLGNVSLYGQVSDPQTSNILGVEFQLWRSDNPGTIVASSDPNLLTVASGGTAVRVVDSATLVAAANAPVTEFSWKVRAKDSNVFGGWSPVCKFRFDQSVLGAPNVPEIAENTTTIGQPKTITVTKPDGTTIPSGYLVQLNGGAPSSASADAAGNASITFTPTRHTNVLSVVGVSPGGNVGNSTQRIFVSNPGPAMPDGDLTGDSVADLLTVGGKNGLTSGLWLANGRKTGQVSPTATNIGVRGIGLAKHDDQTDYDDAIALTGHFFGSGQQDVLVYLPTGYRSDGTNAGGGSLIEGRGDGSILDPINQATISAGQFEFGDGSPLQLANAGNTTGRGLAYPDLIGIVGTGATSYLDYYPNNNMVGGWGASEDRLTVAPPSGTWSDWTITTAQVAGATSLYLWRKDTGALYLWKGLTHTMGDAALGYTEYAIATSGWNTGTNLALSAGDIDGDGDPDLWTVNASAALTSHLVTISGTTATLAAQAAQSLTPAKHIWSLSDAPPGMGTVTIAHDQVGTAHFTGTSAAVWNTGDLFSPDVKLDGATGVLTAAGAGVATNADFSISLWAKPTGYGGTVVSQDGTNTAGFRLWPEASDKTWRFAMATSDTAGAAQDTVIGPLNSAQVGVWAYITVTYKASTGYLRLYINGSHAATAKHTASWNATGALTVGRHKTAASTYAGYFAGQVAQLQTWNQQLDPFTDASGGTVANRSTAAVFDPNNNNIELYYNSAGTLYELYKIPAGNWYISNLGTPVSSTPTALYDPNNHYMEVYYNSGGALKEKAWNPGGTGWTGVINLAGSMTGSPTAINNPSNTNQQLYFADGGVLKEQYWNPSSGWSGVGQPGTLLTGVPSVIYNAAKTRIEVYYNSDGVLARSSWTSSTGWTTRYIGGVMEGSPTAVYNTATGNVTVLFNSAGKLAEQFLTGSTDTWSGPRTIGGVLQGSPSAAYNPSSGAIDVYFKSGSYVAEQLWSGGTWSGPRVSGSTITNSPTANYNPNITAVEAYFSSGGLMAEKHWNAAGGAWATGLVLGGTVVS